MKVQVKKSLKGGFSLVELLVVIAVIGIMAAIAIPMIGKITDTAKISRAKRNAQNIASVANAAIAADSSAIITALPTGLTALATALNTGAVGAGSFSSTTFIIPNISTILTSAEAESDSARKISTYIGINSTNKVVSYLGNDA